MRPATADRPGHPRRRRRHPGGRGGRGPAVAGPLQPRRAGRPVRPRHANRRQRHPRHPPRHPDQPPGRNPVHAQPASTCPTPARPGSTCSAATAPNTVPAAKRGGRVGAGEPLQEPVRRWRAPNAPAKPKGPRHRGEPGSRGERHVVVLGDLNEGPTVQGQPATNLAALVDPNGPLVEVYALRAFDPGPRPGTFQSCGIRNRLDYILVSHDLAGLVVGGGIERCGLWGRRQRQPPRPSGTTTPRSPAPIRQPPTTPPSTST
jgi:hypothetical protein